MSALQFLAVLIVLFALFEIAVLLRAADSRDDICSPEWERRQMWRRCER